MLVKPISDGTFGRVVRVFDGGEKDFKALKIIKSVKRHI
jgi:dual-specificity kinase/CDC-like kinase